MVEKNYIWSTGPYDEWTMERRRVDIQFILAFSDMAEKFPQLKQDLPQIFRDLNKGRQAQEKGTGSSL